MGRTVAVNIDALPDLCRGADAVMPTRGHIVEPTKINALLAGIYLSSRLQPYFPAPVFGGSGTIGDFPGWV